MRIVITVAALVLGLGVGLATMAAACPRLARNLRCTDFGVAKKAAPGRSGAGSAPSQSPVAKPAVATGGDLRGVADEAGRAGAWRWRRAQRTAGSRAIRSRPNIAGALYPLQLVRPEAMARDIGLAAVVRT
jgi:hypothetical protein